MLGIVPQSVGSPAAPPAAGDIQDAAGLGIDAGAAASAEPAASAFGAALASACEDAANAGDAPADRAVEWAPGIPGVWLDLSRSSEQAGTPSGRNADDATEEVDAGAANGEGLGVIGDAVTIVVSAPATVTPSVERPASASVGTHADVAAGVTAAAETVPDAAAAVHATTDRQGRADTAAVPAGSSDGARGSEESESASRSDQPANPGVVRDAQAEAGGPWSAAGRNESGAAAAVPGTRGSSEPADSAARESAPAGDVKPGVPISDLPPAREDQARSQGTAPGRAADSAPASGGAQPQSTPSAAAAGPGVVAPAHDAPEAASPAGAERGRGDAFAGAIGDAGGDAPGDESAGDRGHASGNDSGMRAANSDTTPQRPGLSAPAAFSALITAADGTLRLGAPVLTAGAGTLSAGEQIANIGRMVQTMRVMVRETMSEATVRLRPEHLGEVTIDVKVDGKSVSAVIHSDSATVREWMQGQESTLRSGLSDHGLHLDKLHVQRDGRQDAREGQQQPERRRARARQTGNAQGTFEITV